MYEDVPLFLGPASKVDGNEGDFIFAADASISISQPSVPRRSIDDNKIRICQFNNGGTYPFASPNFTASSSHTACFGPTSGPPKSLSTSIYKIPKDTKITFPGRLNQFLYCGTQFQGSTAPLAGDGPTLERQQHQNQSTTR